MMGPLSFSVQAGFEGALAQCAVLAAVLVAAWALHVWRLRAQHRDLMRLVDERTNDWRNEMTRVRAAPPEGADGRTVGVEVGLDEGGEASGDVGQRVLTVAPADVRAALASRLAGLGLVLGGADSPWSARVACRDAQAAGIPYDVVLVDAVLAEAQDPGEAMRLDEDLRAFGARMALVRSAAVPLEEGAGGR